jgi:hypothetical protein
MRSPPDQISRWRSAWLFPSGHITRSASSIRSFTQIRQECSSINAKPTGPDQPLTFSMALPPQAISPAALHPSEASPKSDKNVQASSMRSPPDQLRRWRSAWFISYQKCSCPAPRFARQGVDQGGIEALPSLNCHLVNGLEKILLWSADFPLNQIENRPLSGNCHSYPPRPPNTHYVRKQQLSLACRLAFII